MFLPPVVDFVLAGYPSAFSIASQSSSILRTAELHNYYFNHVCSLNVILNMNLLF